jgi:hypothetical protein
MNLLINQGSSGSEEELNDTKSEHLTNSAPTTTHNSSTVSSTGSTEVQNLTGAPVDTSLPINLVLRMR